MGQYIIHKDGAYNIFSTVIDAPYFDSALTRDELTHYVRTVHGTHGLSSLDARLGRAHATGCSAFDMDLQDCISGNRAGPNESEVPYDEFISRYLTLGKPADEVKS